MIESTLGLEEHIRVYARIRPSFTWEYYDDETNSLDSNKDEIETHETLLRVVDSKHLVLQKPQHFSKTSHLNTNIFKGSIPRFKFDRVFDQECTQQELFHSEFEPMLKYFMEGFNATIFAYGQTGSGKTHTMIGHDIWSHFGQKHDSEQNREINSHDTSRLDKQYIPELEGFLFDEEKSGLIPRLVKQLFSNIEKEKCADAGQRIIIKCSYIEIYNDKIYDLISEECMRDKKYNLVIREDNNSQVAVPGAKKIIINNVHEIYSILSAGAKTRAVRCTDMNDRSSRSHSLFQLFMEKSKRRKTVKNTNRKNFSSTTISKFNLVDLAGSERFRLHTQEEYKNQHLKELSAINSSLSCLGHCISALLQPKRSHIPYRNSSLTRLLKDSLNGKSLTSIIITLNPSLAYLEETISTLKFADRAKQIIATPLLCNEPNTSDAPSSSLIDIYEAENSNLRQSLLDSTRNEKKLKIENLKLRRYIAKLQKVHLVPESQSFDTVEVPNITTTPDNADRLHCSVKCNDTRGPEHLIEATALQTEIKENEGKRDTNAEAATLKKKHEEIEEWEQHIDPSTGYKFYYNRIKGLTQWNNPFKTT